LSRLSSVLILLGAASVVLGLIAARATAKSDACASGEQPFAEVQIDTFPHIELEVARTSAEHERGLMDREWMAWDHGMLFVYTSPAREGYWMRNTLIPLSIAWLDQSGTILDIQDMEALDDTHVHYPGVGTLPITQFAPPSSVLPYWYALEMNKGWFADRGVGVGHQVQFCLGSNWQLAISN
jgi:uncharacterized membrane protein (UPF0127 family)